MLEDFEKRQGLSVDTDLMIGPWTHSTLDEPLVHEVTATWLEGLMKDGVFTDPPTDPIRYFTQPDHGWRGATAWPPEALMTRSLHLRESGELSPDPPASAAAWTYIYDPADPTPMLGGPALAPPPHGGSVDNSAREARHDVITFTSVELSDDWVVYGAEVHLHLVIDNPYVDVLVRLCDVDERGVSRNFTDGFVRLNPDLVPEWSSSAVTQRVTVHPTAYLIRAGHRLRLQVSSGDHPLHARNPGTEQAIANATDLKPTRVTVISSDLSPSIATIILCNQQK